MKLLPFVLMAVTALPVTTALAAASGTTATRRHAYMAHGKIDALNAAQGMIKLTHSAIPALGWPGMTMQFPLKSRALARGLRVGEQVQFDLVKTANGYAVSRIAPLP